MKDPLDKNTSVAVVLTESGVQLKARSRAVAAIDRLVGNLFDAANLSFEKRSELERAKIAGEKLLIETAAKSAVARMKVDPDLAERAIENNFGRVLKKQQNRDAVAHEAIEQLKLEPPGQAESSSGPDTIDESVMARLEAYSDDAFSTELRSKWARVLASEIRRPGTFSMKAMRIVDEIDAETARLFEHLCASRLGKFIPVALAGEIGFPKQVQLSSAELIAEPGLTGHLNTASESTIRGEPHWFFTMGKFALSFAKAIKWQQAKILSRANGKPAYRIYILTSAGEAIATMLADQQQQAFEKLRSHLNFETFDYVRSGDGYVENSPVSGSA